MTETPAVWINGTLHPVANARITYDDHGITVGDGVFETIKLDAETPFALDQHLTRLRSSASTLQIPVPDDELIRSAIASVAAGHKGVGFIRVTLTAGPGPLGTPRATMAPTLIVAIRDGLVRTHPTAVTVVPWTRNERGALAGVKSTSYAENVRALMVATELGSEEALFANTRDELCEGTGSNVFVGIGGRLLTPPLESGCLAGITRGLLLAAGIGHEERITMAEFRAADEAFLVSTAREVQPISAIDIVALPLVEGPLTAEARAAWNTILG